MLSQGHQYDVPPALHMSMIARTITSIIAKNPYSVGSRDHRDSHRSHHVYAFHSSDPDDILSSDEDDIHQLHAL